MSEEHLFHTNEGNFIIPQDWKSFIGEDTLSYKLTLKSRIRILGVRYNSAIVFLKKSDDFLKWWNPNRQRSLGISLTKDRGQNIKTSLALKEKGWKQEALKKAAKTNLIRYGSVHPSDNLEVKKKARLTSLRRFGKSNFKSLSAEENAAFVRCFSIEPLEPIIDRVPGHFYKARCLNCGREFNLTFKTGGKKPRACPYCNTNSTIFERALTSVIISLGFVCVPHFRIDNFEIDIYIPKLNLGIEVNGIFSHNSTRNFAAYYHGGKDAPKPKDYHLNKTLKAQQNGIELIHIWEHEPLKSEGLAFLKKRLQNKHLDFPSTLPEVFKLRRDFYPVAPSFNGYSCIWQPEILITDRNCKSIDINSDKALKTYTTGFWIYIKNK